MRVDKKGIGLVIIGLIVGAVVFTIYITNGRDTLKKNDTESIFVDEGNEEEVVEDSKSKGKPNKEKEEIQLKDTKIAVDIKGEVKNPGVYYLKEGSIILDLINEAGGVTDKGSLQSINRAEKLKGNECIIIPSTEEEKKLQENGAINSAQGATVNNSKKEDGKVNINTADEKELDTINGVGPSKANAIIKYREENGPFKSVEDIKSVSGFGDATFEKIKDSISV